MNSRSYVGRNANRVHSGADLSDRQYEDLVRPIREENRQESYLQEEDGDIWNPAIRRAQTQN